jgi:hypothetical protein
MEYTDGQIAQVMESLEIDQDILLRARTSARALDTLKREVKKTYRKLALVLHPDRTGNDPEKSFLFQLATEVVKEIQVMEVISESPRCVKWAVRLRARATVT